jgi:hypothetical protein
MNADGIDGLQKTLADLGVVQLLLAFVFVTAYTLALGGMLSERGRWRGAFIALATAIGFTCVTNPWVHGVMLTAFAIAGIGLFMALSWLLTKLFSRYVGSDEAIQEALSSRVLPVELELPSSSTPPSADAQHTGVAEPLAPRALTAHQHGAAATGS